MSLGEGHGFHCPPPPRVNYRERLLILMSDELSRSDDLSFVFFFFLERKKDLFKKEKSSTK